MKRLIAALVVAGLLTGCSTLRGHRRPATPTIGERIPVLSNENQIEVDAALAGVPVTVPSAYVNADWPTSGGNASKSMIHVALGDSPQQLWTASIGEGSSVRASSSRMYTKPEPHGERSHFCAPQARTSMWHVATSSVAAPSP